MKKRLQGIVIGLLLAMVFSLPALAKEAVEPIQAVYKNIKIVLDGVLLEPKDVKGNVVEPFIYNGTTYLPVRAIGQAFNKDVRWDGVNNTVYIGSEAGKAAKELTLYNRSYTECSDPNSITSYEEDGTSYIRYHAKSAPFEQDPNHELYDIYASTWTRQAYVTYPLNGLAKTFSGELYFDDNTGRKTGESMLTIYNSNNEVIYTSPIIRDSTEPVKLNVDVDGETSIKLVFDNKNMVADSGGYVYIRNPVILSTDY